MPRCCRAGAGVAPIQRAIEAGDGEAGVCLMRMEKGLDTGPVLLSRATPIAADDTGGRLRTTGCRCLAPVLAEGLAMLREGRLPAPQVQSGEGVTYAHKLDKAEARLDWTQPASRLADKVRAFDPWPVAEAGVGGERLRITPRLHCRLHAAVPGMSALRHARWHRHRLRRSALRLLRVRARAARRWP